LLSTQLPSARDVLLLADAIYLLYGERSERKVH